MQDAQVKQSLRFKAKLRKNTEHFNNKQSKTEETLQITFKPNIRETEETLMFTLPSHLLWIKHSRK